VKIRQDDPKLKHELRPLWLATILVVIAIIVVIVVAAIGPRVKRALGMGHDQPSVITVPGPAK